MSTLPLKLHILGRLCGFPGWLLLSLVAHGAIFGWLAEQARIPAGSDAAVLQIALVEGGSALGSRHLEPMLRGIPSSPSPSSQRVRPLATQVSVITSPTPTADPAPQRPAAVELVPTVGGSAALGSDSGMEGTADGSNQEVGNPSGAGVGADTALGAGSGLVAAGARLGTVREDARLVRQIRPVYPPGALAQGWEGEVLLRLQIATDGSVQQVVVERSSGHEALDHAARRAARSWLFFPARQDGVPVAADVRVPVVFDREGR